MKIWDFEKQLGFSLKWGGLLCLLAFGWSAVAAFLGWTDPTSLFPQIVFLALMGPGLILFVGGGVFRPLSRAIWLKGARPSTLTDQGRVIGRMPASRLWQWWFHVDQNGQDRDN